MRVRGHNQMSYETRDFNMRLSNNDKDLPIDPQTGLVDYSKIKVGV